MPRKYVWSRSSSTMYVDDSFTQVNTLNPSADKSKYPFDRVLINSKILLIALLAVISPPESDWKRVTTSIRVIVSVINDDWLKSVSSDETEYTKMYGNDAVDGTRL